MNKARIISGVIYAVFLLAFLYVDFLIYQSGHPALGAGVLAVIALWAFVYSSKKVYSYRYLFPSLLGFGVFVILPLIYTIYIAFTNYSGVNLLTLHEVQRHFLRQKAVDVNEHYPFQVFAEENGYRIALQTTLPDETTGTQAVTRTVYFETPVFEVPVEQEKALELSEISAMPDAEALKLPQVIQIRESLKNLVCSVPGSDVELKMNDFRSFAPTVRIWKFNPENGSFVNRQTEQVIKPDFKAGFYRNEQGDNVGPGFRVYVGAENFTRIFRDESVRGPFMTVFIWTILFALLSVITTFIVGFLLAVLLEWKALRFQKFWRSMVILPYAVPAFISILIFRGLFNPQFGDINNMLAALFGIRPEWTSDPYLARTMVLIVNLWLGYPYMMILCTGILQSVPGDIYEASAIDGGSPFSDLFKMTMPLILPPLKPLLIASFAFNFNNFLLIQLLTGGAPQIVGASTAVGYTDILVTYTFNLAFRNAGSNFGFASAIATIIFIIVSILSYVNLKAAMRTEQKAAAKGGK
jgi:maltose/maltodextrin transport system permease protein